MILTGRRKPLFRHELIVRSVQDAAPVAGLLITTEAMIPKSRKGSGAGTSFPELAGTSDPIEIEGARQLGGPLTAA